MGKNDESSVVVDDSGIIRVTVVGRLDKTSTSELIKEVLRLMRGLRRQGKRIVLLSDLTRAGKIDADARRLSKEFFKTVKYDRIAIFGANKENSQTLRFIVNTIAKVLRVRFFKTESGALRWLRLGKTLVRTRAKWLLALAASSIVLAVIWYQYAAPYLLRLPADFSYQASVISHNNFYNEQTAGYSGATMSNSKLSYTTVAARDDVLDVKSLFEVHTTAEENIFAAERTYGIDRKTGMHMPGRGDRNRSGYLFGPRKLAKQEFTYWHVNYDAPVTMKFEDEETVLGLSTYRYGASYRADQTKDLKNLPGVGITRGVTADINLQLWLEPQTGYLIKFEDHATAYFYDLASGKRLNPWNQFSNSYNFDSIVMHVQRIERAKRVTNFVEVTIPALLTIVAAILFVMWARLLWGMGSKRWHSPYMLTRIVAATVGLIAVAVVIGWLTDNVILIRLHPSFAAMHILTALSFIFIAMVLWLTTLALRGRRSLLGIYILLSLVLIFATTYFVQHFFNTKLGLDAVLRAFGLPSVARISPITPVCFTLVSIAIIASLKVGWRFAGIIVQTILGLVFILATIAVAGYVFSLEYIYSIEVLRSMALHTTVLLMMVVIGVFAMHPEWYITRQAKKLSKALLLSLGVLVVSLALASLSWQQAITTITKQAEIQFQGNANVLQASISGTLSGYIKALQGASGLIMASEEVDRSEWKAYTDRLRLAQNYPGMQGIGFSQVIPPTQKAAHIAKVRGEGFPAYDVYPEGDRSVYSAIVFIEPFTARNQRAFGYDMLSEPVRRAAMEQARDTGEAAMSGRVTLVQETGVGNQAGFLLYVPVYRPGVVLASVEQRQAALIGYIYAPIRAADFMRATLGEQTHGLNVGLFDTVTPNRLQLRDRLYVFNSQYGIENRAYTPTFVRIEPLSIAGRTFMLRYSSLPSYDVGVTRSLPAYVLFTGVVVSLLLAALTFLLSSSRSRALKLAAGMTEDLRLERNAAITTHHKAEAILSSIGDGVFVVDRAGRIVLFNRAAEAMSGFSASEAVGQPYKKILQFSNGKTGRPVNYFVTAALAGHKADMAVNTILRRKDGTTIPVADSAAPIINASSTPEGAVVVFRDVTKEKQLEHMKDEFLSVASHELRTPMGAVRANLSMILEGDYGPVNKDLVEPLTDMRTSTIRLVQLVGDLLNVARIEAGRLQFILSEFDIEEVLRGVVSSLVPLGKEKGVRVILAPGSSGKVQADADKLKQVLMNLIGNALKFTDKGSIVITTSLQKNAVEVTVADTGMGIAPEDQKKLFGKFKQITSAQEGKPTGTGLGLYISREIIRKMGGELWIKTSVPEKGSSFAFTLPRAGSVGAKKAKRILEQEAEMHPDQK
ncbi:MAG TPA: porin PorA family protein [Candidatus Saccharimonadales bacterium]